MTDPGQKIAQAFEREGRLDESAFQWLADLLNRNKEAAELAWHDFQAHFFPDCRRHDSDALA